MARSPFAFLLKRRRVHPEVLRRKSRSLASAPPSQLSRVGVLALLLLCAALLYLRSGL